MSAGVLKNVEAVPAPAEATSSGSTSSVPTDPGVLGKEKNVEALPASTEATSSGSSSSGRSVLGKRKNDGTLSARTEAISSASDVLEKRTNTAKSQQTVKKLKGVTFETAGPGMVVVPETRSITPYQIKDILVGSSVEWRTSTEDEAEYVRSCITHTEDQVVICQDTDEEEVGEGGRRGEGSSSVGEGVATAQAPVLLTGDTACEDVITDSRTHNDGGAGLSGIISVQSEHISKEYNALQQGARNMPSVQRGMGRGGVILDGCRRASGALLGVGRGRAKWPRAQRESLIGNPCRSSPAHVSLPLTVPQSPLLTSTNTSPLRLAQPSPVFTSTTTVPVETSSTVSTAQNSMIHTSPIPNPSFFTPANITTHTFNIENLLHHERPTSIPMLHRLPSIVSGNSHSDCQTIIQALATTVESLATTVETLKTTVKTLTTKLTAMENRLSKLETPASITPNTRAGIINEIFTDKRLLECKASLFVTGRVLTSDDCTKMVTQRFENQPSLQIDTDTIRRINSAQGCGTARDLTKWAVFELYSLNDLVGRNCLGGGHYAGVSGIHKRGIDSYRLDIIKEAVFTIYPPETDADKKRIWKTCVDKVNTDIRYLFSHNLRKDWLQIGL